MALRALWKAVIECENLSVPVKLYTAVRPHGIQFRMLHDQDRVPVRQVLECPVENKEVPREHAVRGYEVRKDQYVIVTDEDLDGCGPQPGRSIRVLHFCDPADIDPIYYEKAQYLGPDEHAGHAYAALVAAMKQARKVAVVRYVLRGKQYLAAIRPLGDVLCLEQMRYKDEVLPVAELADAGEGADASVVARGAKGGKRRAGGALAEREVAMAEQLVEALASKFDPTQYRDEYQECVMDLIRRKAGGEVVPHRRVTERKATRGKDLTDALRASIEHVKRSRQKDLN